MFPWASPTALVPLTLGLIGLVCLGLQQRFLARHPMFRPSMFTNSTTIAGLFGAGINGMCLCMIFYFVTVFWIGVRGLNPIQTGMALLPETFSIPLAAIMTGIAIRLTGRIQWASWIGWPMSTLALGLFWFMDITTPVAYLFVIHVLAGVGCGIVAPASTMTVLVTTSREDAGHAMAMIGVIRAAGQCLGIAVGTAVFYSQMKLRLQNLGGHDVTLDKLMQALNELKDNLRAREALIEALRTLWYICCSLSAISTVLCCVFPCPKLSASKTLSDSSMEVKESIPQDNP
jgi:hypothetical protein